MSDDVLDSVRFDKSYINKIFNFDVRTLEKIDSADISKYAIAMSQYLVYLKYSYNKIKTDVYSIKRYIDSSVSLTLTDEILKKYKTKTEAKEYIIATNIDLSTANDRLADLEKEIMLLDGVEKPIYELINCFKKELSRRESEYKMSYRS